MPPKPAAPAAAATPAAADPNAPPAPYSKQPGDPAIPQGHVNIRDYLTGQGVDPSQIGFNQGTGYVTVGGNDYYQPSLNIRGHTFADPGSLPEVAPFLDQSQTPGGQQEQDILSQLRAATNQPLDVTQSPEYSAIQAAAAQSGKLGGQQAEEDLNARGILNSSQTAYQVGQAQAQAQAAALPQEIAAAQQAQQTRIGNLQNLFGETNTLQQQQYNQKLQQEQATLAARQQEISNAWNSVQNLGYVDNQSAIVLGVPAGTQSFDAQKTVETLMNQLNIAQQKNATTLQAAQARADATLAAAQARAGATVTAAGARAGNQTPPDVAAAEHLLQSLTTQADSYRTNFQPVPASLQSQIDTLTQELQAAATPPTAPTSPTAGSATPSAAAPGSPTYNQQSEQASIDQAITSHQVTPQQAIQIIQQHQASGQYTAAQAQALIAHVQQAHGGSGGGGSNPSLGQFLSDFWHHLNTPAAAGSGLQTAPEPQGPQYSSAAQRG